MLQVLMINTKDSEMSNIELFNLVFRCGFHQCHPSLQVLIGVDVGRRIFKFLYVVICVPFRGGLSSPATCSTECKFCLDSPWYQEALDVHKKTDESLDFFLKNNHGFD